MPATLKKLSTAQLSQLNDNEFNQLFAGSPIKRIGPEHLRGNIQNIH
jgi:epoxyqueuosine reductase QueG